MSDNYDNVFEQRLQAVPDQQQRLERPAHDFKRPNMLRPWIAAAVLVAIVVTFLGMLILDSGSSNNPAPPRDGAAVLIDRGGG